MQKTKKKAVSLSAKKKAAKIKASNAKFKKMSAAQRRVTIAKDVIAALKAKKFVAECGSYVGINLKKTKEFKAELTARLEADQSRIELQDVMAKSFSSCTVCAKGAMFVSAVKLANDFTVGIDDVLTDSLANRISNDDVVCDRLDSDFERDQLDLIELAFEGEARINDGSFSYYGPTDNEEFFVACAYARKYLNPKDRMIAIMDNIIKNKGTLVCKIILP